MKEKTTQYTIRQIPKDIDGALRKRAVKEKKSLNSAVLDALRAGSGAGMADIRYHDLDACVGSWVTDHEFDRAMEAFEAIDKDLWK